MTPEQWQQVKGLFEHARGLPPAGRSAFLAVQAPAPEVRQELQSLLEAYDESPDFLEGSTPRLTEGCADDAMAGRQLGSWRLLREIGRGGMGVVWEGERADGEYQQRVAVKLLQGAALSRSGIARFREERRLLALLEHPSIARLLDGGAADDGTPYLVMEYVDGLALDAWCERRNPDLRKRLELFQKICAAVAYAHRHLVIHRDLKPANVLVTPDGSPKLLDFGIARLLEPGHARDSQGTQPSERILTPGYASPEQVRGEPASTVSDVYSLGVLLFLMLTGRRPYAEDSRNPLAALRAVLEEDPPLPSAVGGAAGRRLRGELDAIVLCALRKNPDQRYPSVQAFARDIEAWLAGRPVEAHADSRFRLAIKFLRRNRVQSLAAGLVLAAVLAGSAVSLWQAGLARGERNRAEASFRDVRRFSRSVLFELNDAVRNLPGSTPVRMLLLRRATELLDNLSQKAGNDAALQLELVESYRRLGQIQGSSFSDNLGHVDMAIESFRKAVRLGEGASASPLAGREAAAALLGAYEDLGDALLLKDPPQADAVYGRYRELLGRMERFPHADNKLRFSIAAGFSALGYYETQRNQLAPAKLDYRRAEDRFASLAKSGTGPQEMNAYRAFALKRLGAILIKEQSLDKAEALYRQALEIETAQVAAAPGDKRQTIDRTMTLADLALILKKRGDLAGAASAYQEVVRIRRAALEADPQNRRYLSLASNAALSLAGVEMHAGRYREALDLGRLVLGWLEPVPAGSLQDQVRLADARVFSAIAAFRAASAAAPAERRALLSEGQAVLRRAAPLIDRMDPSTLSPAQKGLMDDLAQARELNRKLSGASPW